MESCHAILFAQSTARQDLFVTHYSRCELLLSLLMMLFYISPAFLRTNMFVITGQDAPTPPHSQTHHQVDCSQHFAFQIIDEITVWIHVFAFDT